MVQSAGARWTPLNRTATALSEVHNPLHVDVNRLELAMEVG
jgi:hypothetical protein